MSWFICDGSYRVYSVNSVGRHGARIIEIENLDTGGLFHGAAQRLERLFLPLGSDSAGEPVTLRLFRIPSLTDSIAPA